MHDATWWYQQECIERDSDSTMVAMYAEIKLLHMCLLFVMSPIGLYTFNLHSAWFFDGKTSNFHIPLQPATHDEQNCI